MNIILDIDKVKELKSKKDGSLFYLVNLPNGYHFFSNKRYVKLEFMNSSMKEMWNVWLADHWKTKVFLDVYDQATQERSRVDEKEVDIDELRSMLRSKETPQ